MAKRKKPTALQRRRQKEKEREENRLYQEGKIPPQKPKSTTKRRKIKEQKAAEQKAEHWRMHKDPMMMMDKQQLQNLSLDLFDEAYHKYYGLKQKGISNVATSIYESDFAGQAGLVYHMDKNTLRAVVRDLRRWLQRKDVQQKRAKRNFDKHLKKWGFKSGDEAKDFWNAYRKWRETSDEASNADGSPPGVDDFMEAWYNGMASGADEAQIFDDADKLVREDYEDNAPDLWDLPEPPDYDDEDDGEYDDFFFT